MSYTLEWQGDRLEIRCYGQPLAVVPPETATEVWAVAAGAKVIRFPGGER
ncbi:MAG: hypothetical protein MI785_14900 [Kiloniellales bacterium]|nr:hypothetical protein [Kiloniellales bacterium]